MEKYNNFYTRSILERVAAVNGIKNPIISYQGQVGSGEGFTGDVFFVSLKSKYGSQKLDLIVKQSNLAKQVRDTFPIHILYQNECIFYGRIWPALDRLQAERLESPVFDNVAKCYATDVQNDKESLILENLKVGKFITINKKMFFDREHVEYIFKKYGQFHGLSFAYKDKNPEEFQSCCELLTSYWDKVADVELFSYSVETALETCLSFFEDSEDAKLIEVVNEYVESNVRLFKHSVRYNRKNGAILHGDCWSNNVMLKYDKYGKIEDIKLIDFQISSLGSVVYDLSYFLYSGSTKTIFDNLNDYLKIYHKSLSDTCSALGCETFISFEELKEEWREYSKFGFIMALLQYRAKFTDLPEDINVSDIIEQFDKTKNTHDIAKTDDESLKTKVMELTIHMFENGFL